MEGQSANFTLASILVEEPCIPFQSRYSSLDVFVWSADVNALLQKSNNIQVVQQ